MNSTDCGCREFIYTDGGGTASHFVRGYIERPKCTGVSRCNTNECTQSVHFIYIENRQASHHLHDY